MNLLISRIQQHEMDRPKNEEQQPVLIAISAIEAYTIGVYHFYQASDSVWLCDYIHPNFMELLK
jgi:RNA:NAD 2'-phosphotransferase (TPT1/KptA family)